jgi:hypothetical protein
MVAYLLSIDHDCNALIVSDDWYLQTKTPVRTEMFVRNLVSQNCALVLAVKMFTKGCMNAQECKLKATSVVGDRSNAGLCGEVQKILASRRMLDDSRTLYVSNLPPKITQPELSLFIKTLSITPRSLSLFDVSRTPKANIVFETDNDWVRVSCSMRLDFAL